ncbi:Aprataxin [Armadillidium vulgare]|nr:Aprataxin [Armadillidium vulgare]
MNSSIKRKNDDDSGSSTGPKKSFKGHWSQGLLQSMSDPALLVEKDEKIVIIKDKYPKAKYHFLVLPQECIPDLKSLNSSHLKLLKYMHKKGENLAAQYPGSEFRFGYHAIPSMSQIHLHVISQDFNSPCLKTKKHWNSFTTSYFIDSDMLIQQLKEKGNVKSLSEANGKQLLSEPLKCHKCDFVPKNMPNLKEHLLKHIE